MNYRGSWILELPWVVDIYSNILSLICSKDSSFRVIHRNHSL